jgi:cytochrome c oxidase assembly protein subunit 15
MEDSLYDLSPILPLLLVGAAIAALPVLWVAWRHRHASVGGRLHALTLVTLFLTFDLILFGAFTRLTDSGLGCPDWPGCYGSASPVGARAHIAAAQEALPSGPVTHGKAWIEMVHRYLATGVGALITLLAVSAWWMRRTHGQRDPGMHWLATATLVWVCVQGAFGALTVTMGLFPAIVTLHLLGGYTLLALLVWQAVRGGRLYGLVAAPAELSPAMRAGVSVAVLVLVLQAASGAWVSTNYAVLACTEFPKCQGVWWPDMDFAQAFQWWRPLGLDAQGESISFQAITAIHFVHRLAAVVTVTVLLALAARLYRTPTMRTAAKWLAALVLLQVATGLSNVVLGWPLVAAVAHTGGAAAMVGVLVWVLARTSATVAVLVPSAAQASFSPAASGVRE